MHPSTPFNPRSPGGGLASPLGSCSIVDENEKSSGGGGDKPLSYKKSVFRRNKANSSSASVAAMAAAAAASGGGGNMSIPSSIVDVDSPLTARGSPAGTLPRRHHLVKGQGRSFLSLLYRVAPNLLKVNVQMAATYTGKTFILADRVNSTDDRLRRR